MTADDYDEPIAAVIGVPVGVSVLGLSVTCPCCEEAARNFEFDELNEYPCGNRWSVADENRFDYCDGCGAHVDYGTVIIQINTSK